MITSRAIQPAHPRTRHRPCLCEAIASYLLALRAERRSEETIRHYQQRLARLRVLVRDKPPSGISAAMLRRSLVRVKSERRDGRQRPISDRYVYQHHAVWRSFFNWCLRERRRRSSPMVGIRAPRVDERELAIFTREDVRALVRSQSATTFEGARNRAIMFTFYDTGMRVGELVQLGATDLDLDAGVLHVRLGKSRRHRRVPLSPRLRRILRAYIDRWRRPVLFPPLAPSRLFTDRFGRALRTNAINQWMTDAGAAARVRTRCSPHTWRHTFATEYLRNGGTERGLMLIMGITTSRVLDRYVHLVETEFAARQHRKASPLSRL